MRSRSGLVRGALFFLAFLGLQIVLQAANRSFASEYARTYDEAAHYVTGLMVRDFIASLDWTDPMGFAETYYLHYPKVAIGHWPPVFYLVQGLWTLVLPPDRISLMLLISLLAAGVSFTVYETLRPAYGTWAGFAGGLLFPLLPLIQLNTGAVMAEALLALCALWAALAFGRYLETGRPIWAACFGLLATLAIMTKANGLLLALLPLLCLLVTRRFGLLRRVSFWAPAVGIAAVCAPWYALTLEMLRNGPLEQSPEWGYTLAAVPTFSLHLLRTLGFGLSAFATVGLATRLLLPASRGRAESKWTALGCLLFAALLFHWVIPADFDPRHMIVAVPAAICFTVAGLVETARRLPAWLRKRGFGLPAVALVGALLFAVETFSIPGTEWSGFASAAREISSRDRRVVVVCSDPAGEGALVAEVATRDRQREVFVLRCSKVLAISRWDGSEYRQLYHAPNEVLRFLEATVVDAVVFDDAAEARFARPHHDLLRQTLEQNPDRWREAAVFPAVRHGVAHPRAIRLFVPGSPLGDRPPVTLRIDLTEMLGRVLVGPGPSSGEDPR